MSKQFSTFLAMNKTNLAMETLYLERLIEEICLKKSLKTKALLVENLAISMILLVKIPRQIPKICKIYICYILVYSYPFDNCWNILWGSQLRWTLEG
ncbi:unnamed protein product [Moneuplotes crassus]|uniref:Uncharacterized protein n=1 Tax=Euplotes crassus TaxID=5936 RepID=A0AAD2CXQ8_EUPCR|nr:unnamed protein product [Moneuplotes crassus]